MDKIFLNSQLNKLVPGSVLEIRRFGRSEVLSVWVEADAIVKVGTAIKHDLDLSFDWLENISVVEFEKVLVTSYFLRSTALGHSLILRVSLVPTSPYAEVFLPSIRSFWPMGEAMEKEASEMFGILFYLKNKDNLAEKANNLPDNWNGFPLRKSYAYPQEVFGIAHSRPFNLNQPTQKILSE